MAVKTLKMIIREFFLTLTDHELNFLNCKSFSVMTGSPFFQLQPKLTWLAVLSSNALLYDLDSTRFQNFSKKFLDIFVQLVPLEILSHYPDFGISHRLREDVQRIMDKVLRQNLMV